MATSKSADRRSPPSSSSADLVDEYHLVIHPVVLGEGTPFFPRLDRPIGLKLIDTRVFGSGVVYQSYAATHE